MANEELKQWILKQRLQNYGYDYPFFRKLTSKKASLKKQIKNMSDTEIRKTLAKAGILGGHGRLQKTQGYRYIKTKSGKKKLVKQGKKEWDYTVGQSFNEELLNIMQLSASKGKKSFWEVQSNWF